MALTNKKARILDETLLDNQRVQLLEAEPGILYLRRADQSTSAVFLSGPLFSDPVALMEARDIFPDQIPWRAIPVDSG